MRQGTRLIEDTRCFRLTKIIDDTRIFFQEGKSDIYCDTPAPVHVVLYAMCQSLVQNTRGYK